jgi:hypothetical protein
MSAYTWNAMSRERLRLNGLPRRKNAQAGVPVPLEG